MGNFELDNEKFEGYRDEDEKEKVKINFLNKITIKSWISYKVRLG